LLAACALSWVMSGCSSNDPETAPKRHVSQFSYDPALCTTLLPDTGNDAVYEDLQHPNPIQSSYFEKRYDRSMLDGVLSASGLATQKYIELAGVELYKVPFEGPSNTCLFQYNLPIIPDELSDSWDESAGGDHGGGHLDGLFIAYSNGGPVHQAIAVREDSSRWTLVHEMMHANFFRQRQADNVPGGLALRNEVTNQYSALNSTYKAYRSSPSPELLKTLVTQADSVAHLLYLSLSSGALEEIADESLLLQEWADSRLEYVSESSAKNAAWYINFAHTLALKDLNDYSKVVRTMQSSVGRANASQFQPTLDFIASVNAQAEALSQKASAIVGNLDGVSMITAGADLAGRSRGPDREFRAGRAHVEAASNTPAMIEFRTQTAAFLRDSR